MMGGCVYRIFSSGCPSVRTCAEKEIVGCLGFVLFCKRRGLPQSVIIESGEEEKQYSGEIRLSQGRPPRDRSISGARFVCIVRYCNPQGLVLSKHSVNNKTIVHI